MDTDAPHASGHPDVSGFFDDQTSTISYLVVDPDTGAAAIIDPVLDFDAAAGRTATASVDRIIAEVLRRGLKVGWILETHVHADHLSAAAYLKSRFNAPVAIGTHVREVQRLFKPLFNLGPEFATDGSQFDRVFEDGETFRLGSLSVEVLWTPGHTPADLSYRIGDALFVGDTLFMPDYGTARCDFPGGDATTLYRSIRRILTLPGSVRLFVGHDYRPGGRAAAWETTIVDQCRSNIHVRDGTTEDDFVTLRRTRDATLAMPRLMLPSIQVNLRAGILPSPEDNGIRYLKIPLNRF